MKPRILVVDDDNCFVETIRMLVKELGGRVSAANDAANGYRMISQSEVPFDLVIIDYHLPDMKGAELAQIIKRKNRDQQIAFATGDLSGDTLTALLKTGSSISFLSKGDSPDGMLREIEKGISAYRKGKRILQPADEAADISEQENALAAAGIVGKSNAMFGVLQKVRLYAGVDVDVLVTGESGVGKELVVGAMLRPGQKLLAINCAAFSESSALLESELFGHAKGAFTDAKMDKPGLFEVAEGQIVFLDEFHTLSLAAQGKLLRFLQEKKVRRVGENFERDLKGRFRTVFATKPCIREMAKAGKFLPDLLYRISKAEISVPPLRERPDDLEPLVLHFASLYGKRFSRRKLFESSVLREMERCPWPGNVRELENVVARLVLEVPSELVTGDDFLTHISNTQFKAPETAEEKLPLDLARRAFEKQKILVALKASRTVTDAAIRLSIARTTLISRLKRFGIDSDEYILNQKTKEEVHAD